MICRVRTHVCVRSACADSRTHTHTHAATRVRPPPPSPQVVREHYLRDDIYSGSPLDAECPDAEHKLAADAPHYLVIDTNVALHQIDFLEHDSTTNVVRSQ
jgi:hypothetical protein